MAAQSKGPLTQSLHVLLSFCLSGAVVAAVSHLDVNKVTARQVFFFFLVCLFVSSVSFFAQTDCGVERETPQVIVAALHFLVLAGRNSA